MRDSSGRSLSGGKVYFYQTGTTNEKAVYEEAAMTSTYTQPIALDTVGRKVVFGSGKYKVVVRPATGTTTPLITADGVDMTDGAELTAAVSSGSTYVNVQIASLTGYVTGQISSMTTYVTNSIATQNVYISEVVASASAGSYNAHALATTGIHGAPAGTALAWASGSQTLVNKTLSLAHLGGDLECDGYALVEVATAAAIGDGGDAINRAFLTKWTSDTGFEVQGAVDADSTNDYIGPTGSLATGSGETTLYTVTLTPQRVGYYYVYARGVVSSPVPTATVSSDIYLRVAAGKKALTTIREVNSAEFNLNTVVYLSVATTMDIIATSGGPTSMSWTLQNTSQAGTAGIGMFRVGF
jgi:hypothetical protein